MPMLWLVTLLSTVTMLLLVIIMMYFLNLPPLSPKPYLSTTRTNWTWVW